MVKVEVCIRGDVAEETGLFAKAAFQGGADTIELCGSMQLDGLTPLKESIEAAIKSIPIKENDIILITGSLYLAGEVLSLN